MKTLPLLAILLVSPFAAGTLLGQEQGQVPFPVTPATPRDFATRNTGVSMAGSAVARAVERKKVTYTYVAVSPKREWTNDSDRKIVATLLAFEAGPVSKTDPLTIVKDGKIRLLKEGTHEPYVVELKTLSEMDQKHVKDVVKANLPVPKKADEEIEKDEEKAEG